MISYILNIILSIGAVITGILSLVFFFIGFADDSDLYAPAVMWLMLCVGCVALSYLIVAYN